MDVEKIGRQIELHYHHAFNKKVYLQSKYSWKEDDARLTVFAKISNVLSSANLGYFLMYSYLQKKDWWKQYQQLEVTELSIKSSIEEFEMFFRIGLIHNIMYGVESSFRIYVRTIDPQVCNKGMAEFKSIYEWLLKKLNLQANLPLLDLWRNIRNAMHNNGLFFPTNGKNQTVVYGSISYNFEVGKHNDFVTTELIISLIPSLTKVVEDIVESLPLKDINYIAEIS